MPLPIPPGPPLGSVMAVMWTNDKFDWAVHVHVGTALTPKDEAPPLLGILMSEGLTVTPLGNEHFWKAKLVLQKAKANTANTQAFAKRFA
ncbi:MAG TPA: hypothetical protein VNW97_01955 [Candidatus Saccharimonadales bacterium]|nr:hypothetical protein [Candidatus Saccharimonadales bacterium]